jgi:hypothetical protein
MGTSKFYFDEVIYLQSEHAADMNDGWRKANFENSDLRFKIGTSK